MAAGEGNVLKLPSQTLGPSFTPSEILYSYARFTQKGVTLASGQGLLAAGTVLGRVTATKKWKAYSNAAVDGTEVARGVLRREVDTADGDVPGNIVVSGILKLDKLVGLDAAAVTDLNGREDSVMNTFTF